MAKRYKYSKAVTIDGHRYWIRADSLLELGQKIERKRKQVEEDPKRVSSRMTVRNWAYICIDTYKTNQKEVTRQKYESRMKSCILKHIGDMQLSEVRPLHCQQVLNLQAGKSKTQINEVYQTLRFLFGKALDNELIRKDPTTGLTRPAGYRNSRRALTAAERAAFIAVGMTERRFYMFMLMLFCGCRPSEAIECRRSDITLKDGYPMLHIRGTKTKNADRTVPVPEQLYEAVKGLRMDEYIVRTDACERMTRNSVRRTWEAYKRQLNIYMGCKVKRNALVPPYPLAPDLVPYCLRHEYCTELARKGIDLRVAQYLMGHSDIKLTANIYTNLQTEDMLDAVKTLYAERPPVEGATEGATRIDQLLIE